MGGCAPLRLPRVIGHRGAAARAPENTPAGLRRAKALGCAWVEFDVRLTGDGALVLCHDARLDRTTSGSGPVSSQTLASIRQCDAGSWFDPNFAGEKVPTLEEALWLAAELDLGANVEIKADRGREYATAAAVADTVEQRRGRTPALLVSSFLPLVLAALRDLAPTDSSRRTLPVDPARLGGDRGWPWLRDDWRRSSPLAGHRASRRSAPPGTSWPPIRSTTRRGHVCCSIGG